MEVRTLSKGDRALMPAAVELLERVRQMPAAELAQYDLPEETMVALAQFFHSVEQGAGEHQEFRARTPTATMRDLGMRFDAHVVRCTLAWKGRPLLELDEAALVELHSLCLAMKPELAKTRVRDPEGMSLGHLAYENYRASLNDNIHGAQVPPWADLGITWQRAWNDAIEAVYQRVKAMADPDYDETPRDGIPMIDMPPRIGVDFHNGEQPASVYKLPPPDKLASEQGIVIYIRSDLAEPDHDEDGYEAPSGHGVRDPEHKSAQEELNRRHAELLRKVADLPAKVRMGDLVRLRAPTHIDRRGPMFVTALHAVGHANTMVERATCAWFRENGSYQDETYATNLLEHVTFVERLA